MSDGRRGRRLALGTLVLVGAAAAGWPRVRSHPVFRVEVIRLVDCPDRLRDQVAEVLQPLVGMTFFDVSAQTDALRQRLRRLPEVADAGFDCQPPRTVAARVLERRPTLALAAGGRWLSVDDSGVIVRAAPRPEPGLPAVYGLRPAVTTPGAVVQTDALAGAATCVEACGVVLGAPPATIGFEPGGAMRARTAKADLVLLGRPVELERKLHVFQAVRNRLPGPVAYVDVSAPEAPVWRPGGIGADDAVENRPAAVGRGGGVHAPGHVPGGAGQPATPVADQSPGR